METSPEAVEAIRTRLNRYIDEFNGSSGKPYAISISMGAVPYEVDYRGLIEQLLSETDRQLYEQKRLKRDKAI